MPLSWLSAFKRALIYFLWLIVWGIVGILMMAIGYVIAMVPLVKFISDITNGRPPTFGTDLLTGLVLAILGYLITILGATATFIRMVYQLSYEATQEVLKGKPPGAGPTTPAAPVPEAKPAAAPAGQQVQPAAQQPSPGKPQQPMAPTTPSPTSAQKYCAFCGRSIAINARFCPFCQRAQP
jgi:hypothetical protein